MIDKDMSDFIDEVEGWSAEMCQAEIPRLYADDELTTSQADVYAAICFSRLRRCIEEYEEMRRNEPAP